MPRLRRVRGTKNRRKRQALAAAWSGLRGSNSPPSAWEADALPDELNPQKEKRALRAGVRKRNIFILPAARAFVNARGKIFPAAQPRAAATHDE